MCGRKADRMKSDFVLEFKRQMVHLFLGLGITVAVYFFYPIYGNLILIPLMISVSIMIILPRIVSDLKVANHLLYHFERDHDIINFPFKGAIWYCIGIIFPILFLPLNIACAIIAVLSAGDSMSTIIGKFYGKYRIGHKSIEGFLGFIAFGFIPAVFFVPPSSALVLAFLGAIIELVNFIDDNFLVPVGLTILYYILNIIASNPIF